jgi:hypothetical protein
MTKTFKFRLLSYFIVDSRCETITVYRIFVVLSKFRFQTQTFKDPPICTVAGILAFEN